MMNLRLPVLPKVLYAQPQHKGSTILAEAYEEYKKIPLKGKVIDIPPPPTPPIVKASLQINKASEEANQVIEQG